jgi:MFS family permease
MSTPSARRLTPLQWLICAIAALGFAFDIYEILMAPLVVGPAIGELTGFKPGTPDFNYWVGMFFWVPALVGGAFGLVGGYLTDRFGRRRVLVWSILIYAFSAAAAGFSTNIYMLLVLRSTTYIGVFVEFVAAVAWIAEIFPDPKQREKALGYTQAFSSIGGLMVTGAYYLAVTYGPSFPAIAGSHAPWRYTLISGVIPALPLILIRPFLPESPAWQQKKASGTLRRPSIAELFTPALRRTTIVTTLMFAFAYGAAFGAIQQMPRIVPGIEEVRTLPQPQIQQTASGVQAYQEFGGLAGRFLLAVLALQIVSRQRLVRTFQIPGLVLMPLVFYYAPTHSLELTKWGMFLAGVFTVGQLSFWGNYLPRVYPTHLRGTGEGFAANIGGRMLGTGFAFVTTTLTNSMPGATPPLKLAAAAAIVGTVVYAAGLACSFFLPEPKGDELPE